MPQFAPEALRSDIRVIEAAVEQGDPAFDRYLSRRQIHAAFRRARAEINRPMTEFEFYRVAAPVVAALGNGHAQLSSSPEVAEWLSRSAPLLPLGVRVINRRIYVLRDFSEAGVPAGAEIVSINGVSAARLLRATVRTMALDGMSEAPRLNSAGGWSFLYGLVRLQSFGPTYHVVYRFRGARSEAAIEGRPGTDIANDWRVRFPNDPEIAERAAPGLSRDGDLAILRISHWDNPVEGQPGLSEHFAEWFAQLEQTPPDALVIDIRNNSGGNEGIATELLSYLVDHPFRYYSCLSMNAADFEFFRYVANADELRSEIPNYTRPAAPDCQAQGALEMTEAAFSNLGVQTPRQPQFRGRVYLLVNSSSFSTSAEFASMFQALNAGTIVGQETSGGYLGDSSGIEATVRLPATGMTFNATLIAYHMAAARRRGVQGGVVPDRQVVYRIEDLLAERDLELDLVRAMER